jgi:hypothetical protein
LALFSLSGDLPDEIETFWDAISYSLLWPLLIKSIFLTIYKILSK